MKKIFIWALLFLIWHLNGYSKCSRSKLLNLHPGDTVSDCEFSNQDLQGIDLSGIILNNIKFNGSNLEGANFNNTVLNNVSFEGSPVQYVNDPNYPGYQPGIFNPGLPYFLTGGFVNLKGATFNEINSARGVVFVLANLRNAQIKGSRFVNSMFFNSFLEGTDMGPLIKNGEKRETNLVQDNVFSAVNIDNTTNVNLAHLPLSFFLGTAGLYSGTPYFYFG